MHELEGLDFTENLEIMRIRRKRISKRSKENFKNLCKPVIWIGW